MIPTEKINQNTENIDISTPLEIVTMINEEDKKAAEAVKKTLPEIARAVEIISENFKNGGRLFYFGAGTSGRLGVLDASECPPTFSTEPEMVQGIIAGGERAIRFAIEGAEDSEELAKEDFERLKITKNDTIVSISASGNAKYVVKVLAEGKTAGCKTIAVTSNPNAKMKEFADCFICAETGAEVISGSTRMKAGTAQKMILNMLTTASMVRIGKTYGNLMVDVRPTNSKLKNRAVAITSRICACDEKTALKILEKNGWNLKEAVLQIKSGMDFDSARKLLAQNENILKKALIALQNKKFS